MKDPIAPALAGDVSREKLLHALYEAAELEHDLMCTYIYAAASLREGAGEGLEPAEAEAVSRWRREILDVAIDEMGHLAAVWNLTSALGGTPRFGRANFPLDAGLLPAGIIVRLAPFGEAVLQHFLFLERPEGSDEKDGEGFETDFVFSRAQPHARITPMAPDYATVGAFYASLGSALRAFVERNGEQAAFCGDRELQLSPAEVDLAGAEPVICARTALERIAAIVQQGEGAPQHMEGSHFQRFCAIRHEFEALRAARPGFSPAHPAATNPVLRPPVRPGNRVWIENEAAARVADAANAAYALMVRLLAYSYQVARPSAEKALAVDLAIGLMRAFFPLAEQTARMPAGPSHPGCNAGVSFIAPRDAAPLYPGTGARRFFTERFAELLQAVAALESTPRIEHARAVIEGLESRARRGFEEASHDSGVAMPVPAEGTTRAPDVAPVSVVSDGVETVEGQRLVISFETRRCIHARFCVTGAPKVFLANVKGPWIHPDAMDAESLVSVAHACPSGAITYRRKDGRPEEEAPPVNLLSVREAGPYAVRAPILLSGKEIGFRATLCRCGASKNKPFCDGSHHEVGFAASGEPPTSQVEGLAVRDGVLRIEPEVNGPLAVRGNLEILSGTGRVVARVQQAKLCRCGGSANKPFCDGTHARNGFRS